MLRKIITLGGLGDLPAPGTCGSVAALLLVFLKKSPLNWIAFLFTTLIFTFLIQMTSSEFEEDDPGYVNADELCGMWLALLISGSRSLPEVIRTFIFFRIFDISKIFPVNRAENVPGSAGIMLDDLVAGAMAGGLELVWRHLR
ncbi:MAG: phosphatidylglycerophosphatase A [Candidatus Wallbacteria bacterium]|nr:phosphatidylglycerophosphatase A [Candidatus Wallbacteria bacterium]